MENNYEEDSSIQPLTNRKKCLNTPLTTTMRNLLIMRRTYYNVMRLTVLLSLFTINRVA